MNSQVKEACKKLYHRNRKKGLGAAVKVGSEIRLATSLFLRSQGFTEVPPVIISPITDPLCHATGNVTFEYYNHKFQITKSMIFHKQIAMLSLDKIFTFSPNVRLEPVEFCDTGRHLVEFTQLDLEIKNGTRDDAMKLCERMLVNAIDHVKKECSVELKTLNRKLNVPVRPFKKIVYKEAFKKFGPDFEIVISEKEKNPFWLIDIPLEKREFYDREDPKKQGILVDMDLIYPEGFGEAASGGEREFKPDRISKRVKSQGVSPKEIEWFLEFAKLGLPPSVGFGIGIERLTRFCTGIRHIEGVALFPKIPGSWGL